MSKRIVFTVTNDTTTDQRMHRICNTLANAGYHIVLIGREKGGDLITDKQIFSVFLIKCWFNNGFLFYLEYNLRMFFMLLYLSYDAVCAIDIDTALGVRWATFIKNKKMVFDSHEYYIESPELVGKPIKKFIWHLVEKISLWKVSLAYTVNSSLSTILSQRYGIPFYRIRNLPIRSNQSKSKTLPMDERIILLYQGVMNRGRGLRLYIESVERFPDMELWLVGEGDLAKELVEWINISSAKDRIKYWGKLNPEELVKITSQAHIGLNVLNPSSKSYYYSLANKFFDYMQEGVPSISMDFPLYQRYVDEYNVGYLLHSYSANALSKLLEDIVNEPLKYKAKSQASLLAADKLTWDQEGKKLVDLYHKHL